jgi:arylsulfatase A-like enzyme
MPKSAKPNFVFIMADDLGYADLGCYGAPADVTPCLDRMAMQGVRFTDGYANSPVCSPTRIALMTGRYQYRLRGALDEPIASSARGRPDLGLPPTERTLPSLLREAGYRTSLVGKWHLGYPPHFGPGKSGYDEFFGTLSGGIDYFSHRDARGTHDLHENDTEVERIGYVTDLLTSRAVDYIERQEAAAAPFLLSLHYTAPHWPWERREDEEESRRIGARIYHLDGGCVGVYQTMIRQMDEGIARVLDALVRTGADENTFVVFTSDNGGERFSNTWPLVGKKMDLLEGGIRVPLVARWPAGIAAGGVSRQVAVTMDWVPTFLEAAGVATTDEAFDGMSLLPALRDPGTAQPRDLFWRMKYRAQRAVRSGDWKFLSIDGDEFLFDLSYDARERANFATRAPERLAELRDRYARWEATMQGIPDDARFYLVYDKSQMAAPSG